METEHKNEQTIPPSQAIEADSTAEAQPTTSELATRLGETVAKMDAVEAELAADAARIHAKYAEHPEGQAITVDKTGQVIVPSDKLNV